MFELLNTVLRRTCAGAGVFAPALSEPHRSEPPKPGAWFEACAELYIPRWRGRALAASSGRRFADRNTIAGRECIIFRSLQVERKLQLQLDTGAFGWDLMRSFNGSLWLKLAARNVVCIY